MRDRYSHRRRATARRLPICPPSTPESSRKAIIFSIAISESHSNSTIARCSVGQVSIEDAHCLNDLSLLEHFRRTSVILGVVSIASSKLESSDYIQDRLSKALRHIDADRLLAAPDCGLMMLGRELAMTKLGNMCAAAHAIG